MYISTIQCCYSSELHDVFVGVHVYLLYMYYVQITSLFQMTLCNTVDLVWTLTLIVWSQPLMAPFTVCKSTTHLLDTAVCTAPGPSGWTQHCPGWTRPWARGWEATGSRRDTQPGPRTKIKSPRVGHHSWMRFFLMIHPHSSSKRPIAEYWPGDRKSVV